MKHLVFMTTLLFLFGAYAEDMPPSYFHKPNTIGLKRIEDNSFLLEEAYNQEYGVVQFIQGLQYNKKAKSYEYSYANEIPMTDELHQFSYTVPVAHNVKTEDTHKDGLGDISLEYRTQWVKRRDEVLAATKFSLFLPTGDYRRGTGAGYAGFKMNNALTSILSDYFVMHWNLGMTYYPKSRNAIGDSQDTVSYNYGTSLFYMYSKNFNIFTEFVTEVTESVNDTTFDDTTGQKTSNRPRTSITSTNTLNPGMRWAIDNEDGSQLVPGLSFPMTFATSGNQTQSERSVFLYLSYENKYW
ncbi:MAG: hypothetical protein ACOYL6_16710 [Bacteriovoracaceae bacterium]